MLDQTGIESADTIQQGLYSHLKESLIVGSIAPNQPVSIRSLSASLDISATPVRETLKRLIADSALDVGPNRTPTVPLVTRDEMQEIAAVRISVEGLAAEKAASALNAEDLKRLKKLVDKMAKATKASDTEAFLRANWQFHRMIYAAGASELIMGVIERLWMRIGPSIRLIVADVENVREYMHHHDDALMALMARDGKGARKAIVSDIRSAVRHLSPLL